MYLCDLTREHLISLLPKGGEVAEIGVAEGAFSVAILQHSDPRKLHLIDPWEHQVRDDYQGDRYGNASNSEQDARYNAVSGMLMTQIEAGRVVLHRDYSLEAVARFDDGQLDWIYVDALHSREAVTADLLAYKSKVKRDGFILGHDYTNHLPARQAGFGVVEAVDRFVIEEDYSFLAMTMENFPTYVLTKDAKSHVSQQLLLQLLYAASRVIEIKDFPTAGRFEHHAMTIGGKPVIYPSF